MLRLKSISYFLLFICSTTFAQKTKLSVDEYLFYYTTKIKCTYHNNGMTSSGTGTGFFFNFKVGENQSVPVIITNKHVIDKSIEGEFSLIRKKLNGLPDSSIITVNLKDFQTYWIAHPDTNVDLCIMPIAPLLNKAKKNNLEFFYIPITQDLIPTQDDWLSLKALENIKMIGYPIGLEDTINHLPIVRTGITATPPYYNFNGKELFLIDSPSFPGQSGSPVMVYDIGNTSDKNGMLKNETKVFLLGILFAGPQMNVQGEIKLQNIPVRNIPYVDSHIPINIGYVIKSSELLDFENLLK